MISVMMANFQYACVNEVEGKWTGPAQVRNISMPSLLHFDLDSYILNAIKESKHASEDIVSVQSLFCFNTLCEGLQRDV